MRCAFTDRDIAAYILMWAKRYELSVGPGAWIVLDQMVRDVCMGSIEAALREGSLVPFYAAVDHLIGSGEETQPQPKDVED